MRELEKLVTIKSYGWANILVNLVSQYTSNDKYFRFLIDAMEREGIKLEQIVSLTLTLALQTQSGDVVRRLVSFLENSEHKQHISPEQLFNTLKSKLSFVNIIQSLAKNPNMDLIDLLHNLFKAQSYRYQQVN
ncbi:hypothetical protein [Candidatus Lariskella endosymbiont of Epinotia ramella]|uniref:hypothetical protein n=1 Tax=Candidatus Lariskella endosymbiont of Epinotia ramella TaxID=3066224 RepID=UPI0030CD7FE3